MTESDRIFESPFRTAQIVKYAVLTGHKNITGEGTEDAAWGYFASIEDDETRRSEASDALAASGWTRTDLAAALS